MRTQLFCLFLYTFFLAVLISVFSPTVHLLFFAPFIVNCFYRLPLNKCLWWSLLCGLVIDLLSSQNRLGIHAANYCFVTLCLYHYKFHFFEDRLSTLPVMTCGFVLISTLIQTVFFYFTNETVLLSGEWIKNDLIFIPFQNALYALLAFTIPIKMVESAKKHRFFLISKRRRRI